MTQFSLIIKYIFAYLVRNVCMGVVLTFLPSHKSHTPDNNCPSVDDNPLFFEYSSTADEFPFTSCEDFIILGEVRVCCFPTFFIVPLLYKKFNDL